MNEDPGCRVFNTEYFIVVYIKMVSKKKVIVVKMGAGDGVHQVFLHLCCCGNM